MSEAAAIEQALRKTLPSERQEDAVGLAPILAAVVTGQLSPEAASKQIATTPALLEGVRSLDGKTVPTGQAVVSFGTASQTGDITIGNLVGGNQISLIIFAPPSPRPDWTVRAALGALVVVAAALSLQSYIRPLAPSAPDTSTSAAASAPAAPSPAPGVPAPSSTAPAPAQPTLPTRLSTPVVRPPPAAQAFAERCVAEHQLDLAAERIFLMEAGSSSFILGPDDRRDQPIALALSEAGQPLALVVLDIVQGQSYIARAVLDASCQPLPDSSFSNAEPSRLHMLQAWDNLLLCLASGSYRIRVGAPNHTPVEMLSRSVAEGANCPS